MSETILYISDQSRRKSIRPKAHWRTQVNRLDERGARAFLGLSPRAENAQVRDKRALIRTFVSADDDEELAHVRRARMKLRTIRNFALAN